MFFPMQDSYNATHLIAARVLANGGTVWTPNVDRLIELGCPSPPKSLVISTRDNEAQLAARAQRTDDGAGWLLKFHGDVEDRDSLAFAVEVSLKCPDEPFYDIDQSGGDMGIETADLIDGVAALIVSTKEFRLGVHHVRASFGRDKTYVAIDSNVVNIAVRYSWLPDNRLFHRAWHGPERRCAPKC